MMAIKNIFFIKFIIYILTKIALKFYKPEILRRISNMDLENFLQSRSIIEVSGTESKKFLQGLITNDINKISDQNLIYSAMLNARGAFLYDFFIFEKDQKIMIDCCKNEIDEIVKKLNFYKLRSDVEIKKNTEILIAQSLENQGQANVFKDPRNNNLGYRIYAKKSELEKLNLLTIQEYHRLRIENKIAEGALDLFKEKSFILEFGFNELNAVDYNKGCYVGQELTARTHHLGEIRKKIFHIKIDAESLENYQTENFTQLKGLEINCDDKKLGVILSSASIENDGKNELHALALIRQNELQEKSGGNFTAENFKISIFN